MSTISQLHIPTSSHHDHLSSDITAKRARQRKNTARRLCSCPSSPQWDIQIRIFCLRALTLRYSQRNLLPIWCRDKRTLFLRSRQPGQNMSKRNRIRPDAELRTPFLRNHFCKTVYAGFRNTVVGLARVAVDAGGGGDVDDAAGFAVCDAEVGGCFADEFEGCGVVEGEDVFPLLVGHLVDYPIPGVAVAQVRGSIGCGEGDELTPHCSR